MFKKYQKYIIILIILLISYFLRIQAIKFKIGLDWDEVSLWYESLTNFRSPYMSPLPPIIFGWTMKLFESADYFFFHLTSIIAGTLAVLALFLVLNRLAGLKAATIGGLLFAISPMGIFYSQEARHYSLVLFFASLLLLSLLNIEDTDNKKAKIYLNNLILFISVFLAFQTHLIFSHSVIAICITFIIQAILQKNKCKIILTYVCSTVLASIFANLWIIERQITEDLSKGLYSLGTSKFINSVFTALGPELNYAVLNKFNFLTFQASLFLILAITGLVALKKKNQTLFIFIIINFLISLVILYFTLGEKSTWPWYRYLCPLLPSYLLLITLGVNYFFEKIPSMYIKYAFVILVISLLNTKVVAKTNQEKEEINLYIRLAHNELKDISRYVNSVLIPEANWGFGVESERNLSFYFNGRLTNLQTFYIEKNSVREIGLEDSKWKLTKIATIGKIINTKLKPGNYAIFPYGLIRDDGPFGSNKPKCKLLVEYGLVAEGKVQRVIIKENYAPMLEVCKVVQ